MVNYPIATPYKWSNQGFSGGPDLCAQITRPVRKLCPPRFFFEMKPKVVDT